MLLLVVDVETTGLDRADDHLLEYAAALYLAEERTILWSHSAIVPSTDRNPIPEINGITAPMLELVDAWTSERESLLPLVQIAGRKGPAVTAICAHNAEFDQAFLERAVFPFHRDGKPVPWLDTQSDIVYPEARGSQHLSHLCADHGLPAVQSHRALGDVMMLCSLLGVAEDLEDQVANALKPQAIFEAIVSYDERDLAKDRGFRWSSPPGGGRKMWWRKLPEDTDIDTGSEWLFDLRRVG